MSDKLNRRIFIRQTAVSPTGAIAMPAIISSCSKGVKDKITFGMAGTGEHGILRNLKNYLTIPECRVVVVCDVDKSRMLKAKRMVDEAYKNKGCNTFSDFRELPDIKDMDAVQIFTPGHWYVHQSIMALKAGENIES